MTIRHLYPAVEPSLNLDFANSRKLDPRITFTRGSTATYTDENGIIRTAAQDEARFDHDSDGNSLGLLIEESRTNLWLDSDDPTQKSTANVSCTLDPSVLDPLGNSSGKIEVTAVNTYQLWRQTGFSLTSGSYTFSVYLKAGTISSVTLSSGGNQPNAEFDIANGTVTSETGCTAEIQPAANGWFRCSITWTATSTTEIRTWTINQSTGSYYFVAAAQVEAGSFPTSYIPTTSSTVTRAADAASITGTNFSSWYNQSEGTWLVNYEATFGKEDTTVFRFNTFENNGIFSYKNLNRVQFQYGGPYIYSTTVTTTNDYAKAAMFYESDGTFGGSFEGTAVVSAAGTSNIATELKLAPFPGASGALQSSTSHTSRLTYYDRRLTDAQLQALTL